MSRAQITLHWLVALLTDFQRLFAETIGDAFKIVMRGGAASCSTAVVLHIGARVLVLGFAVWRLWLRRVRGVPAAPAADTPVLQRAAQVTHGLIRRMLVALQ